MITSITLSYEQVAAILEEHLNREVFKTPQRVTAVDAWDWDGTDEHQFAISLEPQEDKRPLMQAVAESIGLPPAALSLHVGPPLRPADWAALRQVPMPDNRGRKVSTAQRAEVVRRATAGERVADIAHDMQLSDSACYKILTDYKRLEREIDQTTDEEPGA